ncbi:copine [Salpingoeca rosetta]|uniref:Copine n=1 Tax=Salpingoeca rosetta (strain ATCC 50818 / BSB-021) TaxID=946362 RepID=F2UFI4_SALR5|nr:copine [Salpingoeca rosetta]EGD75552.1 copine [Salpingoeca rosetta]|eukprot:XP_004992009.1 copine [Salpingoeca rosetta]
MDVGSLAAAGGIVALGILFLGVMHPDMDFPFIGTAVILAATSAYFGLHDAKTRSQDKNRRRKAESAFKAIRDKYASIEEVSDAIRECGLESCNLIVGVDYTKSNDFQGRRTFGGKSLHHVDVTGEIENPYQQVIRVICQTLSQFDEDHLIPAFGFGDITTQGHSVFPFIKDRPCETFHEVLKVYKQITPMITPSGPTNFAPLIRKAIEIVKEARNFHVLLIIADGQVTTPKDTIAAIVEASNYPLSIVMIGVGDGPWDMMKEFDDRLPERRFDNFQFVNFHEVMRSSERCEATFALRTLMEIPDQFKEIRRLNLI